jgi:membrane fusion protein (multidrug efflux system)
MISMKRTLLLCGLAAALGITASAADPKPPLAVRVVQPKRGEITRYVTLPGTVRANQQATLYAKVSGYLRTVAVDKGQAVEQGDALAEIEVPEQLADLKRYQADAKVAEIDLQRLTDAQKKAPDLVLPQALDKARGALDSASASTERTQTLLAFAKITAPFAGIITMRYVDPGAFVPAATAGSTPQGAALFTLMDFSTVRVQTGMPEIEVPFVRAGQPVKVAIEGLQGRAIEGAVSRFSYALEEATRTMLVEADLPNPELALRPGMYATVKVGVEKHTDALLIPVEALVMEKTSAFVFKHAEGKAKKTPVTLGFNDGANVELLKGVEPGEQIIIAGKLTLADGQAVQATDGK